MKNIISKWMRENVFGYVDLLTGKVNYNDLAKDAFFVFGAWDENVFDIPELYYQCAHDVGRIHEAQNE